MVEGKVYYFSPDNLEYEPLDLTYTDILNFCFNYNLDDFMKGIGGQIGEQRSQL